MKEKTLGSGDDEVEGVEKNDLGDDISISNYYRFMRTIDYVNI